MMKRVLSINVCETPFSGIRRVELSLNGDNPIVQYLIDCTEKEVQLPSGLWLKFNASPKQTSVVVDQVVIAAIAKAA